MDLTILFLNYKKFFFKWGRKQKESYKIKTEKFL